LKKLLVLISLMVAIGLHAQTTVVVPFNFNDDTEMQAAGITHEALLPCNSGANGNPDKCDTKFFADYWTPSFCQTTNDPRCLVLATDEDQPCGTNIGHPGEFWLPENWGGLDSNSPFNLSLLPVPATTTSVMMPVMGIEIKESLDTRKNEVHPNANDVKGFGGVLWYTDNNNFASMSVGIDSDGTPEFYAKIKSNGNYYSWFKKVPTILDGPHGVNWSGTLGIDRAGQTFIFKYTTDLVVTPNTNWTTVWVPVVGTNKHLGEVPPMALPRYIGFQVFGAQTSSTACFHSGGFAYQTGLTAEASALEQGPTGQAVGDFWGHVTSLQGSGFCTVVDTNNVPIKLGPASTLLEGDLISCTGSDEFLGISGSGKDYTITENIGVVLLLPGGAVNQSDGVPLTPENGGGGTGGGLPPGHTCCIQAPPDESFVLQKN
jgi:hypothetical protein